MTGVRRAAAGAFLLGLVSACTPAGGPGADPVTTPVPAATDTAADDTAADATAADAAAATDAERPAVTDVVLAHAAFDAEADAVLGSGYVSPVVESGGTCTLELTRDGRTVAASGPAEPDATTTVCGDLAVPAGGIGPGEWRAVLRYRSAGTSAVSEPLVVEVPA